MLILHVAEVPEVEDVVLPKFAGDGLRTGGGHESQTVLHEGVQKGGLIGGQGVHTLRQLHETLGQNPFVWLVTRAVQLVIRAR